LENYLSEMWIYESTEWSPRQTNWNGDDYKDDVVAPLSIKTKKLPSISDSGVENAHIVSINDRKDDAILLLKEMGVVDPGTIFDQLTANNVTVELSHHDHRNYDAFFFYFAWKVAKGENDAASYEVTLAPVIVQNPEDGPDLVIEQLTVYVDDRLGPLFVKALVLRKHLTIALRKGKKSLEIWKQEWNADWRSAESDCFKLKNK